MVTLTGNQGSTCEAISKPDREVACRRRDAVVLAASADADQLLVTGANQSGDAVYNLVIAAGSGNPVKPVFPGGAI